MVAKKKTSSFIPINAHRNELQIIAGMNMKK